MSKTSIYLVMDLINDLVHEDGPAAKAGYGAEVERRDVLQNTARALDKARKAGLAVGFVRVGFSPDYREVPASSPLFTGARQNGIFKLGTWGTAVHEAVAPKDGEFDIVKHRVSPFYSTNLEALLTAKEIGRIVMSGISTNYVVQSCAREAHDRGYECVILEDCCSAMSQEEHDWAIKGLARLAKVTTSKEVDFGC